MLKKVMLYLMMFLTAARAGALTFVLVTDMERLPAAVYLSCGVLIGFGLLLTMKWVMGAVKRQELTVYYLLTIVAVIFNLFYVKTFYRLDLALFDFLIIGTMMDLVVAATLLVSAAKERKYVKIPVKSGR